MAIVELLSSNGIVVDPDFHRNACGPTTCSPSFGPPDILKSLGPAGAAAGAPEAPRPPGPAPEAGPEPIPIPGLPNPDIAVPRARFAPWECEAAARSAREASLSESACRRRAGPYCG